MTIENCTRIISLLNLMENRTDDAEYCVMSEIRRCKEVLREEKEFYTKMMKLESPLV